MQSTIAKKTTDDPHIQAHDTTQHSPAQHSTIQLFQADLVIRFDSYWFFHTLTHHSFHLCCLVSAHFSTLLLFTLLVLDVLSRQCMHACMHSFWELRTVLVWCLDISFGFFFLLFLLTAIIYLPPHSITSDFDSDYEFIPCILLLSLFSCCL